MLRFTFFLIKTVFSFKKSISIVLYYKKIEVFEKKYRLSVAIKVAKKRSGATSRKVVLLPIINTEKVLLPVAVP